MQASHEMNEGKSKLQGILSERQPDSSEWNEAQNRFHFVDRLLRECLGWTTPYIDVEYPDGANGRADYTLGKPIKIVLEAKREAISYNFLPTTQPNRARKLRPLLDACSKLKDSVDQVIGYCALLGARVAVVCNGPQLVIFQALTPGESPLEGHCIVFDGFESQVENFALLWSYLSPEGVSQNLAVRDLSIAHSPSIPAKAYNFIPEAMQFRYRTDFQENLRTLADVLIDDIQDDIALKGQFYRDCYIPIDANNRNFLLSKRAIAERYKRVAGNGISPENIKDKGDIVLSEDRATLGANISKPYIVIGDVGVGKTSFFENLYYKLSDEDKERSIFIHINLGCEAALSATVKDYFLQEVPNRLRDRYDIDIFHSDFVSSIYYKDLASFDRGIYSKLKKTDSVTYEREKAEFLNEEIKKKDEHLKRSLGHLSKGQNKSVILILDNADQRRFEIQQEAFIVAQEIAATRSVLVFVALRPSTFFKSKTSGALSGYQNRLLAVSPPPADTVIEKRLTFALRVAEGKAAPGAFDHIKINAKSIAIFIKTLLICMKTNNDVRIFLSNITGGNIRAVIELIRDFIGSPNIDSRKIVDIVEEKGKYKIPFHEFTKHALLGQYSYYNRDSSNVAFNLFDVSFSDVREHFLPMLILKYMSQPSLSVRDADGFVFGEYIRDGITKFQYIEDQVRQCLRRLSEARLIETPYSHFREVPIEHDMFPEQLYYRVTSIGIYHANHWVGEFSYLDAMSIDTPIFDANARDVIIGLADSFSIADRLKKASTFKSYLIDSWQASEIEASYLNLMESFESRQASFDGVKRAVKRHSS